MDIFERLNAGEFSPKIPWPSMIEPNYEAKRKAYYAPQELLRNECEKEFLKTKVSQKKKDELWRLAWEKGHSSGLYEVALEYQEMACLVNPD